MNAPEIRFPNIGITINHLSSTAFTIFGFSVMWYGIIICSAVFAGLLVGLREARKSGQNPDLYFDYFFFAVVAGVVGARLYYVIFSWEDYADNLLKIFAIREGGLAIYGAIIAVVIVAIIFTRIKKYSFFLFADTGIFGLIIGQAIGRYGNFFNREAFGTFTNNFLAMQYRLDTVQSYNLNDKILQNMQSFDGVQYIQVHPTFLYESLWNILLFIALQFYKKRKKFNGEIFFLYLAGYGIGRLWIEGLRTDQLKLFNMAVSQVLSAILVILAAVCIAYFRTKKPSSTIIIKEEKATENADLM